MKANFKLVGLVISALTCLESFTPACAQEYTFVTLAGPSESPGAIDGIGSIARFYFPSGIAMDSAGNLYVADKENHTIRKIGANGLVTTLAGLAGSPGSSDGSRSNARFNYPSSVAVDNAGSVYVADSWNHTIRKIIRSGDVTTLAGMAKCSGSADGIGSRARFNSPSGVAVDRSGWVYVADYANQTIRKISPNGSVSTLAGVARIRGSADGLGSEARFNFPSGVAVDSAGCVYVADSWNHTIRKISPGGEVTTLAGSAGILGNADGESGSARFSFPSGVAVDSTGNIYVADSSNHTIRKVAPDDQVSTLAGLAGAPGHVDGVTREARLHTPRDVVVDYRNGDVYVTDSRNYAIRKINAEGHVTTLAGLAGFHPRCANPWGIVVDSTGNLLVTETDSHTLRQIRTNGLQTIWAGEAGGAGYSDGDREVARFKWPAGLASDRAGNVYIADTRNHTVRRLDAQGEVTTLAGQAGITGSADGGANAARFNYPAGLATDDTSKVYVADWGNHTIRQISSNGIVTTLAGQAGEPGRTDGPAQVARFAYPADVAVGPAGNLLVADAGNQTIRQISSTGNVTTLAGQPGSKGTADGLGPAARFNGPTGIAVDQSWNIYVADCWNHMIRRISPEGMVTTMAGLAGSRGYENGTGEAARFCFPADVAADELGNIYVADSGNRRIRKITPDGSVTTFGELEEYAPEMLWSMVRRDGVWYAAPDFMISSAVWLLSPLSVAVGSNCTVYITDNLSHTVCRSVPACPDRPVVEPAKAPAGVTRQLDTEPQTATSWYWSVIRRPSGSTAQLSSPSIRNPTFTPDVADLYVFRLQATNDAGAICIRTLELNAVSATALFIFNPILSNNTFSVSLLTSPEATYVLEFNDSLAGTNWTELPPPVIGDGTVKVLTDPDASVPQRFYRSLAALADARPHLYSATDQRIQEISKGVENGSNESKRIQRELVGKWIYNHDIAKANVGFRWKTLTIERDGTLVMEYQGAGFNDVEVVEARYEFIHKGTAQNLPGKPPVVLVTPERADLDGVIPLVNLTVDYDCRVPISWGKVLKFCDLEGNQFVFLKHQEVD